jgi:alkanesulfonate monooxygenase SsuD/methylene tetrahydromethanopterin reductase-like flavin-dependent oxidoreductase (luciferase family)
VSCAATSSRRSPAPQRSWASTRSGSATTCSTAATAGPSARQLAAIDELSGGRLVAALGAGWNRTEFEAFGIPFDEHVSRFEEAFTIIRRLLAGERVTFHGRFNDVDDALLLPPPARRPKLMIGANRPRMLSIALPHVDAWNTWFTAYGNTPEGFAQHNAEISEWAERAGRDPAEIERSACVLVRIGAGGERPNAEAIDAGSLKGHLAALAEAGADEAILVLDPITEDALRSLSL